MRLIHITEKHIRQGEPMDDESCPIGLALQEQLGVSAEDVSVGTEHVEIGDDCSVDLPARAQRFIRRFDHGQPVTPFELVLPID